MSEQAVERSSVGLDQLVIGSPVVGTQADSLEFGAQRCMGDLPMGLESDGSKTTVDGQHRWELASADIYRRLRIKHFPAIVLSRIESPNALLCIVEERKETRVGELTLQIVLLHVSKIDLRDEGLRHAPVLRPASRRRQVRIPAQPRLARSQRRVGDPLWQKPNAWSGELRPSIRVATEPRAFQPRLDGGKRVTHSPVAYWVFEPSPPGYRFADAILVEEAVRRRWAGAAHPRARRRRPEHLAHLLPGEG